MKKAREWNLQVKRGRIVDGPRMDAEGILVREVLPSPETPEEIERAVEEAAKGNDLDWMGDCDYSSFITGAKFAGPLYAAHERKRILGVVMGVLKSDELKYENELNGMTGTPRLWACRLESKLREMGEWNE